MSPNERGVEGRAVPAEQQAREHALVEQIAASFGDASDARLRQLMQALTRHAHPGIVASVGCDTVQSHPRRRGELRCRIRT